MGHPDEEEWRAEVNEAEYYSQVTRENERADNGEFAEFVDFYSALGQFMEAFALYELETSRFIETFAGLTNGLYWALLSGATVEAKHDSIKRLFRVQSVDAAIQDELVTVVGRMSSINKVRNIVVHAGTQMAASVADGSQRRIAMNSHKVYFAPDLQVHPMGVEEIRAMKKDAIKSGLHFYSVIEAPATSLAERAAKWEMLLDPWQYDSTPIRPFKNPPKPPKEKNQKG